MISRLKPFLVGGVIAIIVSAAAPMMQEPPVALISQTQQNIEFPKDVMDIIDAKCMGCHKPDARNEKARAKLQWAQLPEMEKADLVAKLEAVLEVLEKGEMPPAPMLEKYPDMKLTDDETQILSNWADTNLDRILGD